eukprot:924737-Rhodomonas_salina.3
MTAGGQRPERRKGGNAAHTSVFQRGDIAASAICQHDDYALDTQCPELRDLASEEGEVAETGAC